MPVNHPHLAPFDVREFRPDDAAALFTVHAAIEPADAGSLLYWTQQFEERVETGGRAWVLAHGRRLAGYALIDPVPGLPGVFDLTGGVVPARRRQGLGGRLLARVQADAPLAGAAQLSARVEALDGEVARFLRGYGFALEHEECLLELADLDALPPRPAAAETAVVALPRQQAIPLFCRLYERSFGGTPWSQPYSEAEVAEALRRAEDLLFLTRAGEPIGVAWVETTGDQARVEPIGIVREAQGQGHGRRLLLEALHQARGAGARSVQIGTWRRNAAALHLYQSLGFVETANWYYLAHHLSPAGRREE